MGTIALIGGMFVACVAAAFIDAAEAPENQKRLDKMSPQERDNERRFWDRMMY